MFLNEGAAFRHAPALTPAGKVGGGGGGMGKIFRPGKKKKNFF
jgi:hypothetical protein